MTSLFALNRRLKRLEPPAAPPPPSGIDWSDGESWPLIEDTSWHGCCSLTQLVYGRACYRSLRLPSDFAFARRRREPEWWSNPVYLSKPGSREVVARGRAEMPPDWALSKQEAYNRWRFGQYPKARGEDPWQPENGHRHLLERGLAAVIFATAWACSVALVDALSVDVENIGTAAGLYNSAVHGNDAARARMAELSPPPGLMDALRGQQLPLLALTEMGEEAGVTGLFPVAERDADMDLLSLLLAVPSGFDGYRLGGRILF